MSSEFQPAEDNGEVLSKIILLILGIFIGTAITATFCYFSGISSRGPQVAHIDGGSGAAHSMESLPNSGPMQAPDQDPAYAQAAAMQQGFPQAAPAMMAPPQVNYIQTGTPLMMPDQMPQTQTFTQAAPTTLYAGQMMDDQSHGIGRNGMRGNPCVDPPSCRGRAYSQALQ